MKKNEIALQLIFPFYERKEESRFIKLFNLLPYNKKQNKSIEINTLNIINGNDKRSTVIINKIPSFMLRNTILDTIMKIGNINFLYMPPQRKVKDRIYTYAVINFINYRSILELLKVFKNNLNNNNIEIIYSEIQGRDYLVSFYFGNGNKENKSV